MLRILQQTAKQTGNRLLFTGHHFSTTTTGRTIENVLIIGSGLMGSGIAQSCAQSGYGFKSIVLQDISQKSLDTARQKMLTNLGRLKQKDNKINEEEIVSKITFSQQIEPKQADNLLIVEAVPEKIELKQQLFKNLSDKFGANKNVILATNTSSLPCAEIGIHIVNKHNFGGLHFFNPVPMMKLVEVIRLPETADSTFQQLVEFVENLKKVPVQCKDTPGFIVNRLLLPYMMEAVQLVERGDASARDVDTAMKLGAGYPMGPFELMDFVGIDTIKFIIDGWIAKGADFVQPSETINNLVKEGKFGKKSGSGFYDYAKK